MSTIKFVKIYSQRGAARHKSGRKAPAFVPWPSVFCILPCRTAKKIYFIEPKNFCPKYLRIIKMGI